MRVHYLSHVPFEKLGTMAGWLERQGHTVSGSRLYHGDPLPDPDQFDALIVMGGPMGADDEQRYPWLDGEKRLIAASLERDRKILGVCLGAQIIARVLGAPVTRNPQREIGWFPVQSTEAGRADPIGAVFDDGQPVLHWHGDTFAIPHGAVHLARSWGCENQAFRYGEQVLGLQFHLELAPDNVRALCHECADELRDGGPWVQSEAEMLAHPPLFDDARRRLNRVLEVFLPDRG